MLKNSKADYHINKYIVPHTNNDQSEIVLGKDYNEHKAKSKLIPISISGNKFPDIKDMPINGKGVSIIHIKCIVNDQQESVWIPLNRIKKNSVVVGQYNDEQAVALIWNHAIKTDRSHITDLHKDIEEAEKNQQHSLHIDHANEDHFIGKGKHTVLAFKTYYERLLAAAHVVHKTIRHPDFKKDHEDKCIMEVQGATYGKISKNFVSNGVKPQAGVSKGDLLVLKNKENVTGKTISLKHSGGGQMMSGSPAESASVLKHAINALYKKNFYSESEKNQHEQTVDIIRQQMDSQQHQQANEQLQQLIDHTDFNDRDRNHLFDQIAYEAVTGKAKFARKHRYEPDKEQRQVGVANYMITTPLVKGDYYRKNPHGETTITKLSFNQIRRLVDIGKIQKPKIARGKAGDHAKNNPSAMRVGGSMNRSHFPLEEIPKKE